MNITTEHIFETALVQSLVTSGGYTEGNAPDYSPELGISNTKSSIFCSNHSPSVGPK